MAVVLDAPLHDSVRTANPESVDVPLLAHQAVQGARSDGVEVAAGYHTPIDAKPECYFIGDRSMDQSWATISAARRRLLESSSEASEHQAASGASFLHSPAPALDSSMTNGTLIERLEAQQQELSRQLLAEELAEAEVQSHFDEEVAVLRQRSTEEAQAINHVIDEVGGVGRLLREDLHGLDEMKTLLEAELVAEESQGQAMEARAHTEEEELAARIETQQRQMAEMATSRRCMESHLERMVSMEAWLRGDLEDMRRTRGQVEVLRKQEIEERNAELDQVNSELSAQLKEQRSKHDAERAKLAEEVLRLRQESKRQFLEEKQLAEQIQRAQSENLEVRSKLKGDLDSAMREDEELTHRILLLREECRSSPVCGELAKFETEHRRLVAECEGQEAIRKAYSDEVDAVVAELSQARSRVEAHLNWEAAEASAASGGPADPRLTSRLQSELQGLDRECREAERRCRLLHEEDMELAQRGFLGKLTGSCLRRKAPQVPVDDTRPPLPPPSSPPVRDLEKGPYAFREGS